MRSKPHLLELQLPAEMAEALSKAARRSRKSRAKLVLDALAHFLKGTDDYRAVLEARKCRGQTTSLQQIRQRLGLTKY